MARTAGIIFLPMLILFIALCSCFIIPDTGIDQINTFLNFESWDWNSVSRISKDPNSILQFRMQFAVLLTLTLPIGFAMLITLVFSPKLTTPRKGDGKTVLKGLALVFCSWLIIFIFPNAYVGGGYFGVSMKSIPVAVPLLFCISVLWTMSLMSLLLFVADHLWSIVVKK